MFGWLENWMARQFFELGYPQDADVTNSSTGVMRNATSLWRTRH